MENPAQFDLNAALRRWRTNLQGLVALRAKDLAELELHLCDSTRSLQAAGLTEEDAFLVAAQRLGTRRQLAEEFAKVHPRRVWAERALWMVAGVLLLQVVHSFTQDASSVVTNLAIHWGASANSVGVLWLFVSWTGWAAGVAFCWWLMTRHAQRISGWTRLCLQRPILVGLGLVLLLWGLQNRLPGYLAAFVGDLLRANGPPPHPMTPQWEHVSAVWFRWGWLIGNLAWVAALPLLAGFLWRRDQRGAPPSSPLRLDHIEPLQRDLIQALQSQGLSLEEADFIAKRRQGNHPEWEFEPKQTDLHRLWLERSLWMLAGIVLNFCLQAIAFAPGGLLAVWMIHHAQAWPLFAHLAGFLWLVLGLSAPTAVVVLLWQFVTRFDSQRNWIGWFCCQRPVWASLGLIVICGGLMIFGWLVGSSFPFASFQVIAPVTFEWFSYGGLLIQTIIPVSLLLWLARGRLKLQEAP